MPLQCARCGHKPRHIYRLDDRILTCPNMRFGLSVFQLTILPRACRQVVCAIIRSNKARRPEPASRLLDSPRTFCPGSPSLFIAHLGTLIEAAQASFLHGRDVHEYIFAAFVGLDKSVSFGRVEPLHNTCRHVRTPLFNNDDNLGRSPKKPQEKPAGVIPPAHTRH